MCLLQRRLPLFLLTAIYLFCYLLLTGYFKLTFSSLNISIFILGSVIIFWISGVLFPRIVVTVKKENSLESSSDITLITLWADGRKMYKKPFPTDESFQFSFHVWRRDKYYLCLNYKVGGEKKHLFADANTYDHSVCHVSFILKEDK